MAADEIKADIMASIRGDISIIIREELKSALLENFNALQSQLKSMRADITNNTAAIRAEIGHMKGHQGHKGRTIYIVGRSGFITSYGNQPSNSCGNPKRQVRGH